MEKYFINWIEKEVGKPISMTKEAHGDEGVVYEINTTKGNYFLKIKKGSIWSLQYNLGPGHGAKFLKKYGYKNATEEIAEKLRLQYENYQRAHGFLS